MSPQDALSLIARGTDEILKREELAENRWMRPFAGRILRSELWRFTRRSVPRGVAIGLFVVFQRYFVEGLLAGSVK